MKFGCCTNMISSCPDRTGFEYIDQLKELGYDYIELPLAQIMDLSEDKFAQLVDRVNASGLRCESCNNFFPAQIRLTGLEVNYEAIFDYMDKTLQRAAALGVEIIVFGSSGARNVPQGFSMATAWKQLVTLLQYVDEKVKSFGITVVIEPLNRFESNIINTTSDGLQLVKDVNRENIRLLVDYYHLMLEEEDLEILLNVGSHLRHIHFSRPEGRVFPLETDRNDYDSFFRNLKKIGYEGRLSIEAYTSDFSGNAAKTLVFLKKLVTPS